MHTTPIALLRAATVAALLAGAAAAHAGPATDAVGTCLTDHTTGKERKDLARWIFIAMAAHPEIKDLANVAPSASEESSRRTAALLTRLIAESCAGPIRAMVKAEGPQSLRYAFEFLGKAAFQELTTNPAVSDSIQQFQRYVDQKKIEAVVTPR